MRILSVLLCLCLTGCVVPTHKTTHRLTFNDGGCSGTAIGPHSLLSATHCFINVTSLSIDGIPTQIIRLISDGNDHTIVRVSSTFTEYADFGPKPSVGTVVHMYGNPGDLIDLYRVGVVEGDEVTIGKASTLYGLNCWMGDSGAGIFTEDGDLIGVVSFIYVLSLPGSPVMNSTGSYPMAFTVEQLHEAER